ncbi:MAG: c-type cytochrome [Acidobacteriota bacterium]|nr:c-type cytochrome [Acidobacteriota bacterium]
MKLRKFFKYALIAIAAGPMLQLPAFAQRRWDAPRIVTWNCSGCHGVDGNAQPPFLPRLAGLNAAYAELRIAEFRSIPPPPIDELFHRLIAPNSPQAGASRLAARINMIGIAHAMTPEEIKVAAAWFAMQKPAHGRSGSPALIAAGKQMYLKGMPKQGLPPCQTCHGAQAEGKAKTPRLAGQNGPYLMGELAKFAAGDRQHAPEMTMVTQHVDNDQFRALAAYLESR